jgi:hypothetical protein
VGSEQEGREVVYDGDPTIGRLQNKRPVSIPHGGLRTWDKQELETIAKLEVQSPSHTVGLNRLSKKLENQNLNPLKLKTAHREGILTHIQLPS